MKKILFYGYAIMLSMLVLSCGGGDDGGDSISNDYIRIDNNVNNITLAATEKQRKISIYSNSNWSITVPENDWLKIDRSEGSGNADIWLEISENNTTSARSITLTFRSQGVTKLLTITQSSGDLSLTASPSNYDFAADGGQYSFTIQGNSAWKVTSKPEWCEIVGSSEGKSGESQLMVKVGENPNTTNRNGQIVISGEKTITIDISQQGKAYSLTVSETTINMSATGGSTLVKVTCNGSWRISVDKTWCRVSKTNGTANTPNGEELTITCDPNTTTNERPATIRVVAGNDAKVETITVTQLSGSLPEVTEPQCNVLTSTELSLTATYSSMFDVTEYGFYYGTSTAQMTKVRVGNNGGKEGTISTTLTLEDGKTYHIRSYAVSAVGTKNSGDVTIEMKGKQPGKGDNYSPDI